MEGSKCSPLIDYQKNALRSSCIRSCIDRFFGLNTSTKLFQAGHGAFAEFFFYSIKFTILRRFKSTKRKLGCKRLTDLSFVGAESW